jgi:tRNA A37 threonylcarbamoyltransferase TsaD
MMSRRAAEHGLELRLAPRELRTDNAAMVAYDAMLRFTRGEPARLEADVAPSLDLTTFGRCAA